MMTQRVLRIVGALAPFVCVTLGAAQDEPTNPVYLDDAPVAVDTIERAGERTKEGSIVEAARTLGDLIVSHGPRLIEDPQTQGAWVPVRRRVASIIASDPDLLGAYRDLFDEEASRVLREGSHDEVWASYWLTRSGVEATLRRAQVLVESGALDAGVMTIERLGAHPDARLGADRAVGLLALARDAGSPRAAPVLDAWTKEWGVRAPEPIAVERASMGPSATRRVVPLGTPGDASEPGLDGIVSSPIAVEPLTAPSGFASEGQVPRGASRPKPWAEPAVTDDAVVINDGITISCFDRFTMRPRWRRVTTLGESDQSRSDPVVRSRLARTIEDLASVNVHEGVVYAATGLARTGSRTEDNRIIALDLERGTTLRETTLEQIDPDLVDASVRGGIAVVGDTLVLGTRRNERRQRLVAFSLVGINRHTFAHEWTRPIASAGALPFQQVGRVAHWSSVNDGVVYSSDEMGVVCAVVGATGEVLWARTLPGADLYARGERDVWTVPSPLVKDEHLYVLSPDGALVHRIDPSTGAQTGTTRASVSGSAHYLIDTGAFIGCVNRFSVTLHDTNQFGTQTPRVVSPTGDGRTPITGRVLPSGDALVIPITDKLALVPIDPSAETQEFPIGRSGITLALEGQLLVVTEHEIASYLSWDTARRVLGERIEDAADPSAAVSLAELAFRSRRTSEIVPAVDAAVALLDRGPDTLVQDRLFQGVRSMVQPQGNSGSGVTLPVSVRAQLIERLERVARTPEHRLAHALIRGAWLAATSKDVEASRVYHGVLADASLRTRMWDDNGLSVRGGVEAHRRIRELVAKRGRAVCSPLDPAAGFELEALGDNASASQLEALALKFPWALTTPRVWIRAAAAHEERGQPGDAARCANESLAASERIDGSGARADRALVNAAASVLVRTLASTGQEPRAAREIARWRESFGPIELTNPDGSALVLSEPERPDALASVGSTLVRDAAPTLVTGFPLRVPKASDPSAALLYAPHLARLALLEIDERGEPRERWSRIGTAPEAPVVLVHDARQSVILWAPGPGAPGGTLESIERETGRTLWRVDRVSSELREGIERGPDRDARAESRIDDPLLGSVALAQVLSVSDGTHVVLSDRVGRAMCIETISGRVLWKRALPVNRVHDIDTRDGVLGVVGMLVRDDPGSGVSSITGVIAAIDSQTGEVSQSLEDPGAVPRWVRVPSSAEVIAATGRRVIALSTQRGGIEWVAQGEGLTLTRGAWVLPERVLVLGEDTFLFALDRASGLQDEDTIVMDRRIAARGWVDARPIGGFDVVSAPGGVGAFTRSGEGISISAGGRGELWTGTALAQGRAAMARPLSDGDARYGRTLVRLIKLPSGVISDEIVLETPLAQGRDVTHVGVIEGHVIVGFGEVSVLVATED